MRCAEKSEIFCHQLWLYAQPQATTSLERPVRLKSFGITITGELPTFSIYDRAVQLTCTETYNAFHHSFLTLTRLPHLLPPSREPAPLPATSRHVTPHPASPRLQHRAHLIARSISVEAPVPPPRARQPTIPSLETRTLPDGRHLGMV